MAGFAKLEGENFVYYMQTYSIILGRSTETCKVDFDLSELDGSRCPRVSRHHARIFYDFEHRHFALEVLGKNGCSIQNVSYLPGSDPVKLNSQDLVEIAGKKFYFLLPSRSIFATLAAQDARASLLPQSSSLMCPDYPGGSYADDYGHSNGLVNQNRRFSGELDISNSYGINADPAGTHGECVLENGCLWRNSIQSFLNTLVRIGQVPGSGSTCRSGLSTETESRPWCSLLPLLRKYSEDFVMSTMTRGDETSEYVGLVSMVSLGNGP